FAQHVLLGGRDRLERLASREKRRNSTGLGLCPPGGRLGPGVRCRWAGERLRPGVRRAGERLRPGVRRAGKRLRRKIGRGERQGVRAIGRCRGFGRRRNGRRFGRLRKGFGRGGGGDRGLRRFAFAAPLPVLVRRLGRGGGGTVGAGDRIP